MRVTMILEFPASNCHLARGIVQVYLLYFFFFNCYFCLLVCLFVCSFVCFFNHILFY